MDGNTSDMDSMYAVSQSLLVMFTLEPTAGRGHIRNRKIPTPRLGPEVASCSNADDSNKSNPLKSALPKKRGASAKKPSCFPMDLYAMPLCAEPAKPRQART
jgi:hypothetical protein